jgi:hypothetical protein
MAVKQIPHPSSPAPTDRLGLEDLDTQTKLWGTEADLRAIAQFVASIDLRI